MDGNRAVERVMDRVATHVGVTHGADHVEVDAVPTDATHLARVPHLDVLNPCGERLTLRAINNALVRLVARVEHDVRAMLV